MLSPCSETAGKVVQFRLPADQGAELTPLGHATLAVMRLHLQVRELSDDDVRKLAPRLYALAHEAARASGASENVRMARYMAGRLSALLGLLSVEERASISADLAAVVEGRDDVR